MNIKFFKPPYETIDEVKKMYKKLAFQFHPDITKDDGENMKTINNEYEQVLKTIVVKSTGKMGYKLDQEFIDIIDALIKLHMKNIDVEILGYFVWIGGETKPYKDDLRKLGFNWHSVKKLWYHRPVFYRKMDKKVWSQDEIRNAFRSQKVNVDDGVTQIAQ